MGIMSNPLLFGGNGIKGEGSILNLKTGIKININPVQAGTGDPSPSNVRPISGWSTVKLYRTGINLFDENSANWKNGYVINTSGAEAASISYKYTQTYTPIVGGKTYSIQMNKTMIGSMGLSVCMYDDAKQFVTRYSAIPANSAYAQGFYSGTFTTGDNIRFIRFSTPYNSASDPGSKEFQIELGSIATTYTPYAGHTTSIAIPTPPGTVYGGYIEVLEVGTAMLVEYPYYASYAGETLVGPWISSMDVYAPNTMPTTGAQVVDLGGTPTTYSIDPFAIPLISGPCNLWAGSGDIKLSIAK